MRPSVIEIGLRPVDNLPRQKRRIGTSDAMPIGTSNAVLSVLRTHASQLNLWPSSKKYDSKDSKSESKEVVETRGAGDKSSNSSLSDGRSDGSRTRLERRRSEEHTSELQSLMRISYAVFSLIKKKTNNTTSTINTTL